LRIVPSSWARPLLIPTAKRLRHSLVRPALMVALVAGASVGLLAVLR
jgi:hypothetical protein